jgi:hypothetical protein
MSSFDPRKISNLRTNSFVALVMILIEIGIGVGVNLFTTLPTNDAGKSLFLAFEKAVTNGPFVLTIHALLGTIILISGITAIVRAFSVRRTTPTVLSCVAMLAVLVAWLSGSRFVGTQDNGTSLSMAVASVTAVLCYAIIVFVLPATPLTTRQNH